MRCVCLPFPLNANHSGDRRSEIGQAFMGLDVFVCVCGSEARAEPAIRVFAEQLYFPLKVWQSHKSRLFVTEFSTRMHRSVEYENSFEIIIYWKLHVYLLGSSSVLFGKVNDFSSCSDCAQKLRRLHRIKRVNLVLSHETVYVCVHVSSARLG